MGWTTHAGFTKKNTIDYIIRPQENEKAKWTTVTHCVRGNILWYVREIFLKETNTTERFIGCSILGSDKGYGWGSKDMCESAGPVYISCPLKYLDMVPEPTDSQYAKAWREKVRKYHQKLVVGQKVELLYCKIPYVTLISIRPLRGTYENTTYRLSRNLIKESVDKTLVTC